MMEHLLQGRMTSRAVYAGPRQGHAGVLRSCSSPQGGSWPYTMSLSMARTAIFFLINSVLVMLSTAPVQLVQNLRCGVQANGVCVIANKKQGLALNHHDVKLYYVDVMVYVIFFLL